MSIDAIFFNVTIHASVSRPLGAHRMAHFLRGDGLDIEVIDWANFWTLSELKELFKSRYSDSLKFIGISSMFGTWNSIMDDFCKWIKTHYPNVFIISGASTNPLFKTDYIDYYIAGYGEYATLELLKYLLSNGAKPRFMIPGIRGKKIIDANNQYPAYPMKSLMVKYQHRDFIEPREWLSIETSRGCKFNCKFCSYPILGVKEDYSRDAEDFADQLKDAYDRFGVFKYNIADETFNDSLDKIKKFNSVIPALNFSPVFNAFIRADLLISNPAQLEELVKMGVYGHFYGIETFNAKSGKTIGKGMNPERLKQGLLDVKQYFQNHGSKRYRGTIALIIGLPFETKDSIEDTKTWLLNNWSDQSVRINVLNIPISELYKPSAISLDYKKYGYREFDFTKDADVMMPKILAKWPGFGAIKTLNSGINLIWQNEHLNYWEALDLAADIYQIKSNFKAEGFQLSNKHTLNNDLDYMLSITSTEDANSRDEDISTYITKKLNWK